VVVHDDSLTLGTQEFSELFNPFLMFGPNDPVLTASISMPLEEASITFHTSMGGTAEIATRALPVAPGHLPELSLLLRAVSQWGPFPHLRSIHLHIEPNATGPINTVLIHLLLSGVPRATRLTFEGHTLCFHIFQALNMTTGRICSELEYLGGTLYPGDHITSLLRSLSEALRERPTIREVVLDVLSREGEIEGIRAETGPLVEEIESHGTEFSFSFTSITEND
jgi:hypothetical protein